MIPANSELVATAWLGTAAGLTTGQVGTTLPADNSTWAASGFLTVAVVGGTPHAYGGIRRPVVQVDAWAVPGGTTTVRTTGKPPWGKASTLLERVVTACADEATLRRVLTLRPGYRQAWVLDAYPLTEPRRINAEPEPTARFTVDLQLVWAEIPEE